MGLSVRRPRCGRVGVGGDVGGQPAGGSVAGRKRGTGTVLSGYARFWMALAMCLVIDGLESRDARRLPFFCEGPHWASR